MIRRARREDIPQLMDLWEAAFGDDRAYISFFFENRFSPEGAFLCEEAGRPVSMLFLLDARVRGAQALYRARYLYAAATLPSCRGRGLMRSLIEAAAKTAAAEGADCIALVPASQGLFHYYAGSGFQTTFFCETAHLSRSEAQKAAAAGGAGVLCPLNAAGMAEIRREALQKQDYLVWADDALQYALEEHRLTGGKELCVEVGGQRGYCLYRREEDRCFVQEFLAPQLAAAPLLSALLLDSGAQRFTLRLPVGIVPPRSGAKREAFGMLRPLSPKAAQLPQVLKNAYLGLSLG